MNSIANITLHPLKLRLNLPSLSRIFTVDGCPSLTADKEDDTRETVKDSVFSTMGSSTISNSTTFGPVSPASNTTSTVFSLKSSPDAVPVFVAKLNVGISMQFQITLIFYSYTA